MSLSHWAVVALVAVVLFGRGKISGVMGDLAQGIKSFKNGMREDADEAIGYNVAEGEPAKR